MIYSLVSILIISLYFIFFIKNQRLSIVGVILLLPSYLIKLSIFGLPTTFLELILIGTILGFLYKLLKHRLDIRFYKFLFPIILFLLASIVSIKISNDSFHALGIFRAYILEPIAFFVVFINTFKTRKEIEVVIKTLGITALYVSIYAIFQKITGIGISSNDPSWVNPETRRVTSLFEYPNALGLFLAPIITIFLYKIAINFKLSVVSSLEKFIEFTKQNLFNLIVLFTGIIAIISARSMGAILGILASVCLFITIKAKDKIRITLIGIIVFILLLTLPQTYPFMNKNLLLGDYSGKIRLQMWQETSKMLKDNFIFGGGLNNFKDAIQPYHKKTFFDLYLYPHNIILNTWSELGLLGFVVFIAILIIFFNKSRKIYTNTISEFWQKNITEKDLNIIKYKKETSIIISLSMFTLLIHGLVDVPYFKNDLSVLFWIIIGLVIIVDKVDDNVVKVINKQ